MLCLVITNETFFFFEYETFFFFVYYIPDQLFLQNNYNSVFKTNNLCMKWSNSLKKLKKKMADQLLKLLIKWNWRLCFIWTVIKCTNHNSFFYDDNLILCFFTNPFFNVNYDSFFSGCTFFTHNTILSFISNTLCE